MAICKTMGYSELFITFTCNPNWLEVTLFVQSKGLRPEDRPDILSRVFKMKLDQLMNELKTENVFGKARGGNYLNLCHIMFNLQFLFYSIVCESLLMFFIVFCSCLHNRIPEMRSSPCRYSPVGRSR